QRPGRPAAGRDGPGADDFRTPVVPGNAPGPQGGRRLLNPAVASTIPAARQAVAQAREQHLLVGLVPTMGALHEGHTSLIRAARAETGFVVVSLFVNPTQFGPNEDFTRYPRTWDEDMRLCREEGVDLVFAPPAEAIYPPGYRTFVEVRDWQDVLCGAY